MFSLQLLNKVVQLVPDDYGQSLPRQFLKRSVFESKSVDSTCRPSSSTMDNFVGMTPQGMYDQLALLQQLVAGVDVSSTWKCTLVTAGMVVSDDRGEFLIIGSTNTCVRAHQLHARSVQVADSAESVDMFQIRVETSVAKEKGRNITEDVEEERLLSFNVLKTVSGARRN